MKKILIIASTAICILFSSFSSAQVTFQKTFGGTGPYDSGKSVQQTSDGGYVIGGCVANLLGTGGGDAYLIKTDGNGDTLWTKSVGFISGLGQMYDRSNCVRQTNDGGYVMVGASGTFQPTSSFICKTNSNGDTLWTKAFGWGGSEDLAYFVLQTNDGGYIITGQYDSNFGLATYLVKTNSTGDILWSQYYTTESGYSVQQTTDGGFIMGGSANNSGIGNNHDVCLMKTDSIGNIVWAKNYGGTNNDIGRDVRQTDDGGYVICGYTSSFGAGNSDVYLIKTNNNGNILWSKTYGGTSDEQSYYIDKTDDGGYIICGNTSSFGVGISDVYLIKTDSIGNMLWTKSYGGAYIEVSWSVNQTNDGGYIVTGEISNQGGDYDIYLIKTDSFGNSGCNQASPVTIENVPSTVVTTLVPIVFLSGSNINQGLIIVRNGGFVNTLCTSVSINEMNPEYSNSIFISPNPFNNDISIAVQKENPGKVSFIIRNVLGQTVYNKQENNPGNSYVKTLDLSFLSNGIYFLDVDIDGERTVRKIVKE